MILKYSKSVFIVFCVILMSCDKQIISNKCVPNFKLAHKITTTKLMQKYDDITIHPQWFDDSTAFWYIIKKNRKPQFFTVNPKTKTKQKERIEFEKLNQHQYTFFFQNQEYCYDVFTGELSKALDPDKTGYKILSPDNKWVVFCQDHNLIIRKKELNSTPKQITQDGELYYSFKKSDFLFRDEIKSQTSCRPQVTWSPDSRFFLAERTDARHLNDMWVINSLDSPRSSLHTYKQRQPGEKRRFQEFWLYDLEKDTIRCVASSKEDDASYKFLNWSEDSDHFYLFKTSSDQLQGWLMKIAIPIGASIEFLLEENPGGIVINKDIYPIPDTNTFLWWSRRDGFGHYYLYDLAGNLIQQVTSGEYNVDKIIGYSPSQDRLFFTANGKEKGYNPYYNLLYSIGLDGNNLQLLSPENANHIISANSDISCFVDTFSRPDLPHRSVLRNTQGEIMMHLENADLKDLEKLGWIMPETFTVTAADDETELWGVMWKPFDFDPARKYPVISYVYPGPQFNFLPTTFFTELNNVHLAQYGFIVIMSETRGSSYRRSLEFSEYYRQNLRDYPLADNKTTIEQLAENYDFIDLDRVGIWGGSSGGYMAVSAILTYPEMYKVAVARAGQHDPQYFHGWWSDYFQGISKKKETLKSLSNIDLVNNLKGRLFVIHGEMDMIVHPSNSARLVDALMNAGKDFDYLVVPGGGHEWSKNWQYVQRRIWLYFVEHLMNWKSEDVDIF